MLDASPADFIDAFEAMATRHETPAGEGKMVWRCWGEETNTAQRPLVLLHGGSGSWRHWIRNIEAFALDRPVWVPDLPGFGESDLPGAPVHFSTVASATAAGLRTLLPKGQSFDVAGFSFGSHASQYLAAEMGEQIGTMVLVTGHMLGPMLAQPNQMLERWRGVTDVAEVERILKRNLGALMLAHETSMDALAMHIYADDVTRARIRPAKFINDRDFTMIERLPCRVAGIAGSLDPLGIPSPAAQGEALLRARPDARFRLIDNAGHWVAYEAADQFNAVLREILVD